MAPSMKIVYRVGVGKTITELICWGSAVLSSWGFREDSSCETSQAALGKEEKGKRLLARTTQQNRQLHRL